MNFDNPKRCCLGDRNLLITDMEGLLRHLRHENIVGLNMIFIPEPQDVFSEMYARDLHQPLVCEMFRHVPSYGLKCGSLLMFTTKGKQRVCVFGPD